MTSFGKERLVESLLKAQGEDYIYMGKFTYAESNRPVLFVLGTKGFYELNGDHLENLGHEPILPGRSYLELGSVEETQILQFSVYPMSRAPIVLAGKNQRNVTEAVIVFNSMIRDAWQKACEDTIIKAPEVYQFHSQVRKVNRKGKTQDRVLVVSKQWVYNLESFDSDTEAFKWSLPIASLIQISAEDDTKAGYHSATMHFDTGVAKQISQQSLYKDRKTGTKGSSVNDKHQLLFVSQNARNRCAMALCALYFAQTQKRLKFAKSKNSLKNVRGSQLGIVKKEGMLNKYTRSTFGGVGKHQRFFQLKSNGLISWGKTRATVHYFETIVAVKEKDDMCLKFKLSADELKRFLCVQTTGKTLYLLNETVRERDDWLASFKNVLEDQKQKSQKKKY